MTERKTGGHPEPEPEPRIEDLLEDPVLHAILRKDGVSRDDLMAVITNARRRLGLQEKNAR